MVAFLLSYFERIEIFVFEKKMILSSICLNHFICRAPDSLINTTKDMDILTRSGIINNWLNPEEATQFFNKLYHDDITNCTRM
uniref:Uncharacterized protein n=1 Tax=Salix viminalis TaxID=40686 RepID=A0A6N2MS32_SALVM